MTVYVVVVTGIINGSEGRSKNCIGGIFYSKEMAKKFIGDARSIDETTDADDCDFDEVKYDIEEYEVK